MKILHCADLHLDSRMNLLGKEKSRARRAELLNSFTRLVNYADENAVDAVLIAGDMFDSNTVSVTARKAVRREIENKPNIAFYYLKGNHDRDGFISEEEELPANLHTFGSRWTEYRLEAGIFLTGAELTAENEKYLYDSLVLDAEKFNIVMLHGQESSAKKGDRSVVVSIPLLKNKGIDYLALGHVHEYREASLDGRGFYCYPGCLESRGYDEVGEHGFVVLDIDGNSHCCRRSFVKFALRNAEEFNVDVSDCISSIDIVSRVNETVHFNRNNYVKINLTGCMSVDRDDIALDYIAGCFEDRCYCLKIKDRTELRVNFDDYLYEESLKGEFVRVVNKQTELSDAEKAAIIRYGFEAISGGKLDS